MKLAKVPFYKNSKDDFHCVQACLKSVLKICFPNKNFSFNYLDKVTMHKRNKLTWDFAMLLFLLKMGFDVVYITKFDYKKFARQGDKYLRFFWRDDVYQYQKKYSDLKQERSLATKLVKNKKVSFSKRPARFSDLKRLFKNKYLVMVSINPFVLDGEDEYGSHMVLVTNITKKFIYFHDPGNPPRPNRKASIRKFWKAASYPDDSSVDLIAVKYGK